MKKRILFGIFNFLVLSKKFVTGAKEILIQTWTSNFENILKGIKFFKNANFFYLGDRFMFIKKKKKPIKFG